MTLISKRFCYMLMDERAALAARLIARGAAFWTAGGGAVTVAHDGTVLNLSTREAGQVAALLGVRATEETQRLHRGDLPGAAQALLMDDTVPPVDLGPVPEPRPGRGPAAGRLSTA